MKANKSTKARTQAEELMKEQIGETFELVRSVLEFPKLVASSLPPFGNGARLGFFTTTPSLGLGSPAPSLHGAPAECTSALNYQKENPSMARDIAKLTSNQ